MKFKLDENLPADLAHWLREEGHDVADVVEEGLGGEEDPPVLKAATSEGRILLTFDLDFADIRHYPPGTHAGIVVFRLQDQRWKTLQVPVNRIEPSDGFNATPRTASSPGNRGQTQPLREAHGPRSP
jgi:predicted nuclease of predicted toxin-antitoxin system